jgi:hypothetical protein
MNALYGSYGLQRADESKLSPELQTNLQLSRRAFGARWRSPASGEKQQVSLVPETEGPNWLLWGGVAAGVGLLGFVAYRYFTRMPT